MPYLRAWVVLQDIEKDGHDVRDTKLAVAASFAGQPVKRNDPDPCHWIVERVAEDLGRRVVGVVVESVQAIASYPCVRVMESRASRTWKSTWRRAFGLMVDDVLADAVRLKSELPATPQRIEALIRRHDDVLDQVERPALVHFDLWDGNVFVDHTGGGPWRITGLIDGERAFFGDPVAELVSLALYRDVTDRPELLSGYAAGSAVAPAWLTAAEDAPIQLADGARRRLALYATYLYLIMGIEGVTRGFDGPDYDASRRQVLDVLEGWLGELGRRASK